MKLKHCQFRNSAIELVRCTAIDRLQRIRVQKSHYFTSELTQVILEFVELMFRVKRFVKSERFVTFYGEIRFVAGSLNT
jgi:hypothetical protein